MKYKLVLFLKEGIERHTFYSLDTVQNMIDSRQAKNFRCIQRTTRGIKLKKLE